nr:hypothetical protein [uncultured Cohaesibacter sp.]
MSMKRNKKISLGLSGLCLLAGTMAAQAMTQDEAIDAAQQKLKLTDVVLDYRDFYGQNIKAALPNGTRVEVHLDRNGEIDEVEGLHKRGFEEEFVRVLVPEQIVKNPSYPQGAFIHKLDLKDGYKVEIEGYGPNIREFKAEFRHDGKLLELKKEK